MFVGLAMCASVAFAQTQTISRIAKSSMKQDLSRVAQPKLAPVDYKASIFTKDDIGDTIRTFSFADTDMDGINYGAAAVLNATDVINDTATAGMAHTVPLAKDLWTRITDTTTFAETYATEYPNTNRSVGVRFILNRMGVVNNPGTTDDGFMFLTFCEQTNRAGNFNTYFTLPAVQKNNNTQMIEVRLTQAYIKYYDRCFIDYKIGNNWYAREINVTGVDCEVNGVASYHPSYTMPHALANQNNIELRIRALSWRRGSAYGYCWAVDNVAIVSITRADRWVLSGAHAYDGFYGMIPEGMSIPMTFGVAARNISTANLTNATLTVNAGTNASNFTTVATSTPRTVPAGDIEATYNLVINERGFMMPDSNLDYGIHGWLGYHENYRATSLSGGYQGRSLPTATAGDNYYTMVATATNNINSNTLTTKFDTVLYTVSEYSERLGSGRLDGHRWGIDNGLISAGSIFCTQFTDDGFVTGDTADNHYTTAGYSVHSRFITGNEIPENWRFRGIEIIPQTLYDTARMRGTSIVPIIYEEDYVSRPGYLVWQSVPCGIDNQAFSVNGSMANDLSTGYILPTTDYKAITIRFPDQPAMKPNTAYRFGYVLNTDGFFAAAGQETSYRDLDENSQPVYKNISSNPEIAKYANQNMMPPTYLNIIVRDPINEQSQQVTGWNIDHFPLIRPIVGEPDVMPTNYIFADCSGNTDTNGFYIQRGTDSICNGNYEVTVGSSQYVYINPAGNHSVIDTVYLNGVALTEYNEDTEEGDLEVINADVVDDPDAANPEVLLSRSAYAYFIRQVEGVETASYVFTAKTHWEPWIVGIDPVAPEVGLNLAPNPATSTVKLNITGVTGTVNCNIIDMSGRVIYNANINAEGQNTINVSNFPAGAYFVRVTNDTFSKIEKLIIR